MQFEAAVSPCDFHDLNLLAAHTASSAFVFFLHSNSLSRTPQSMRGVK